MCGIVGYIGYRQADELIIKGLERLEYRGYDSSGIAIMNETLTIHKKAGKVKALRKLIEETDTSGTLGIGHTRWATHGEPNDKTHTHTWVIVAASRWSTMASLKTTRC
jgi:glucosamine--fructose-6-phosphate aminotransferase (isomerizing)